MGYDGDADDDNDDDDDDDGDDDDLDDDEVDPTVVYVCLASHQSASVSKGRTCLEKCTCCHTETEIADQTSHLPQSQYSDSDPPQRRAGQPLDHQG